MVESKGLCLTQTIGILGLTILFIWLSLRPKSPSYSILSISIEQPSNSNQNGSILYSLEIKNQNKDSSIYYDDTILSFLYGQDEKEVGETTIGSFHQGTSNTREQSSTANARPRQIKPLLNAISNATAELKVDLITRYRYKTWGIKSKFHGLHLRGILPIDSDGKLSRKKKKYPLTHYSKKLGKSKIRH
ncbi:protein NDR1-like [Cajanus cajan]|uniref:protein NDR1-like n=1 Tax=Cajanus cajan TaxID=3821 RepID=UPI00098D811B|nr:protein NDR1-like [Cajanus cajan]